MSNPFHASFGVSPPLLVGRDGRLFGSVRAARVQRRRALPSPGCAVLRDAGGFAIEDAARPIREASDEALAQARADAVLSPSHSR